MSIANTQQESANLPTSNAVWNFWLAIPATLFFYTVTIVMWILCVLVNKLEPTL